MQIDKNDPEVQELLMQCMLSTRVFAKTFFPEEVESDFSILHDDIFRIIDSPIKKKAIAAPRGLGKTTIAKLRTCKAILFQEAKFICYLSNSVTSAIEQTEHIKKMLQASPYVKALFGDIKLNRSDGKKDNFSRDSWTAFGECRILPRGAGQQVRGLNWMGNRPGLWIIDDLETLESVQNEDQRAKLKRWFFSDLMKTESKYGEPAEFLYIDTIKHEIALLAELMDHSDWQSVRLSICDDAFNSYDPNYMTTEEIKKEYESHREAGETDLFYMELMNIPISLEDAVFKADYFKYFTEEFEELITKDSEGTVERIRIKDLITVVICDPARTVKLQSAESAVVTISVDRTSRKIFIRDIFSAKVKPDQLYDEMFSAVTRHNAMILAVEVTGLHEFVSQPIEQEMRVRGIFPQYVELNAKGKKEMRVATLAPLYRLGYMYHNKNNCQVLENQLHWFPRSKLWDVMDATAYITKIMDENSIFFDPDSDFELPEEFDELEDERLKSNWRSL